MTTPTIQSALVFDLMLAAAAVRSFAAARDEVLVGLSILGLGGALR